MAWHQTGILNNFIHAMFEQMYLQFYAFAIHTMKNTIRMFLIDLGSFRAEMHVFSFVFSHPEGDSTDSDICDSCKEFWLEFNEKMFFFCYFELFREMSNTQQENDM